jgi:hypothetical protein
MLKDKMIDVHSHPKNLKTPATIFSNDVTHFHYKTSKLSLKGQYLTKTLPLWTQREESTKRFKTTLGTCVCEYEDEWPKMTEEQAWIV